MIQNVFHIITKQFFYYYFFTFLHSYFYFYIDDVISSELESTEEEIFSFCNLFEKYKLLNTKMKM